MEHGTDLFRALELAHYAERFRNALFVICLPTQQAFEQLLLDIKVLTGYHIRTVLVVPDPEHQLEEQIRRSNKRGTRFHLSLATDLVSPGSDSGHQVDFLRLKSKVGEGETPVIAYHQELPHDTPLHPAYILARDVAQQLEAKKLFLAGAPIEILSREFSRTHILGQELMDMQGSLAVGENSGLIPWLEFVSESLAAGIPDLILCAGGAGELYKETFTHDGAGLLFNNIHSEFIRPATVKDITDVALLLRPDIAAGRILPVNDNQIEKNIHTYWVYEINGLLAGLARLRSFGQWAELSQFSTLPRYRGKGRARELAKHLEEEARGSGFTHVFALSIDHRMWEFFKGLDFVETSREELPESWQAGYDMERPSRAFVKVLSRKHLGDA